MVGKKRNKLEVIKEILGVILLNRNIKQTNLLYKANLSPNMFEEYTQELIKRKLIKKETIPGKMNLKGEEITRGNKIFNLTELGRQYLEDYKVVDMFLERYDLLE